MIGRITSQQLLYTAQQNMGTSRAQLARLQEQSASGLAISKPSDDPIGTGSAMRVRSEASAAKQYSSNIDDGIGWLATADSSLSASENLVTKAIDLTTQGANSGTMSASSREAIATELDGIRSDLLGQANSTYLGRSVFAGNSDTGSAFDSSYAHSGATGGGVQRRIDATETVQVDADGGKAFGTGASSVFAAIDTISAALRSGDSAAVTAGIDTLRSHLTDLTTEHAAVGTGYARLEQAKQVNLNTATALETARSGIEDVDSAKVLVDLKTQELSYQTALAVTARAIQPTLMSFLS